MALAPLADPSTFIIPACNTALEHGATIELPEHNIKLHNIFKYKEIFIHTSKHVKIICARGYRRF